MTKDSRSPNPIYLLPSLSFPLHQRERQQSSSSTTSETHEYAVPILSNSPASSTTTSPDSSPPTPHSLLHAALQGQLPTQPLKHIEETQPSTLRCNACATDIAFASEIVSKGFTGRHGRAYLVAPPSSPLAMTKAGCLANTKIGRSATRELLTGAHVVADVTCLICGSILGWKYLDAQQAAQRYKIGKYILETKKVVLQRAWEDGLIDQEEDVERWKIDVREEEVEFDSSDEEECDELFSGTWDAEVVRRRRTRKVGGWRWTGSFAGG